MFVQTAVWAQAEPSVSLPGWHHPLKTQCKLFKILVILGVSSSQFELDKCNSSTKEFWSWSVFISERSQDKEYFKKLKMLIAGCEAQSLNHQQYKFACPTLLSKTLILSGKLIEYWWERHMQLGIILKIINYNIVGFFLVRVMDILICNANMYCPV